MGPAKRLTQSLEKLNKIEEVVNYATIHTKCEMEYRRHLKDLREELTNLSTERKGDRIRLAKKILGGKFFQKMKFWNRFRIGMRWIFTGAVCKK